MLGPFATASRFTLSFTRGPTAATVARRLRIDVHNDDDDDDNNNNNNNNNNDNDNDNP